MRMTAIAAGVTPGIRPACPSVSGSETAVPSAVPLLMEMARLVKSGIASRMACGRMMDSSVRIRLRPSALAASHCPRGTAMIADQKISALKADSTMPSASTVVTNGDMVNPR